MTKVRISPHSRAVGVLPSKSDIEGLYWIVSDKSMLGLERSSSHGKDMEKSGKWLIYVSKESADEVWNKLLEARKTGKLHGIGMKISSLFNMEMQGYSSHVICVYTNDVCDIEDVKKVREELRKLGFTESLPYKADKTTLEGRYGAGVSTYRM